MAEVRQVNSGTRAAASSVMTSKGACLYVGDEMYSSGNCAERDYRKENISTSAAEAAFQAREVFENNFLSGAFCGFCGNGVSGDRGV